MHPNTANKEPAFFLNLAWNRYVYELIAKGCYDPYFCDPRIGVTFFGSGPGLRWNGGRADSMVPSIPVRDLIVHVAALNRRNVGFVFVFTCSQLGASDMDDELCNNVLAACSSPLNSVVVASPLLRRHIRKYHSGYSVHASCILTALTSRSLSSLLRIFDVIVLPEDLNADLAAIETLPKLDRIELILNSACIHKCPYRARHLEHMEEELVRARRGEPPRRWELPCMKLRLRGGSRREPHCIEPAQIGRYVSLGIRRFKFLERTAPPDLVLLEKYRSALVATLDGAGTIERCKISQVHPAGGQSEGTTSSMFNLHFSRERDAVVWNVLSGRYVTLSSQELRSLHRSELGDLSAERRRDLAAAEIVRASERDELWLFERSYLQRRMDRAIAAYVWVLTYHCNLRCPYCFERGATPSRMTMSSDVSDLVIDAIMARTSRDGSKQLSVMFFGGEPLLRLDECERAIKELKRRSAAAGIGFSCAMSTNGVLFDPDAVNRLAPHLNAVQITFDGPREIHDTIRVNARKEPTFDRIVEVIRRLADKGIQINVRAQLLRENQGHLPSLIQQLREAGILGRPGIRLRTALVQARSRCNMCPKKDENDALTPQDVQEIEQAELAAPSGPPRPQFVPCIMSGNQFCIDTNGDLYKCIAQVGRRNARVGYIANSGEFRFVAQMWKYLRRNPLRFPMCRSCSYLPLCGGGCPTKAADKNGTYEHPYCGTVQIEANARIRAFLRAAESVS